MSLTFVQRRRRLIIFGSALIVIAIGASSCREPTNVLIETFTDIPYQNGRTVSYFAGKPGTTEFRTVDADATLDRPWSSSSIGTLTVVPEGDDDDVTVTLKLVMGVGRPTTECTAPTYPGCVVARRRIRYVPHARLKLPISLYANCIGVPCDSDSTCNVLGRCVSSIPSCNGDTCVVEGESASSPPTIEGGVSIDGAGPTSSDASDLPDATKDADPDADASTEAGGGDAGSSVGFVRCPGTPGGTSRCEIASQHCCYNSSSQTGACAPGLLCPSGGGIKAIFCDGSEDCPANTPYCCDESEQYVCRPTCATISALICEGNGVCPPSANCLASSTFYRRCFPN
jgi:hypothetical protein